MNKVIIKFKDRTHEIVSREAADDLAPIYAKYHSTGQSQAIKINNRNTSVDRIESMESYEETEKMKLPASIQNNPEYLAAVSEGKMKEWTEAREKLLRLHRHNSRCVSEGKPQSIIYFKYENYKIIKITKEEAEKRHKARKQKLQREQTKTYVPPTPIEKEKWYNK